MHTWHSKVSALLESGKSLLARHARTRTRGFTLLLSALIATIVLALGSSIFSIAQKQVTLSSIGRDSQFAFYAADTGAECALYWDVRYDAFGSTTPAVVPTCDGVVLGETGRAAAAPYMMEFQIDLFKDTSAGYCVDVKVYKNTTQPFTRIHADGYSVSCLAKNTSPRALQRSIELNY